MQDHSYCTYQPPPESSSQTSESESRLTPTCNFSGSFDHCDCVLHVLEDNNVDVPREDSTATYDYDGFSADEYLHGASVQQYQPHEDLDVLTLRRLMQDILIHKDKESEINSLGMDFVKTSEKLHVVQFYHGNDTVNVKLTITVNFDLTPTIAVHGNVIQQSHPVYQNIKRIQIFSDLMILLRSVSEYVLCAGASRVKATHIWIDTKAPEICTDCAIKCM